MVNEDDNSDVEIDIEDEKNTMAEDIELEDLEERGADKMKKLRLKLSQLEQAKRDLQDDLQRAKAEFLNAKKRLEDERSRDRLRTKKQHLEELLPLCDSFQMAMVDKAWQKADKSWRTGVEGIHSQLLRILKDSGVTVLNPVGEPFDPNRHEAVGTEPVTDKKLDDTVLSVLQSGYDITLGDTTETIRPARVITGHFSD